MLLVPTAEVEEEIDGSHHHHWFVYFVCHRTQEKPSFEAGLGGVRHLTLRVIYVLASPPLRRIRISLCLSHKLRWTEGSIVDEALQ